MVSLGQPSALSVVRAETAAVDRLYAALEQRSIQVESNNWVIEVLGIHSTPKGDAWVQVRLADDPDLMTVLHLCPRATPDQAIAALAAWMAVPASERPHILDVMRVLRHSGTQEADPQIACHSGFPSYTAR